jgi:hypothetical protein
MHTKHTRSCTYPLSLYLVSGRSRSKVHFAVLVVILQYFVECAGRGKSFEIANPSAVRQTEGLATAVLSRDEKCVRRPRFGNAGSCSVPICCWNPTSALPLYTKRPRKFNSDVAPSRFPRQPQVGRHFVVTSTEYKSLTVRGPVILVTLAPDRHTIGSLGCPRIMRCRRPKPTIT